MKLAASGKIFGAHGINSDCIDSEIHTALLADYRQRRFCLDDLYSIQSHKLPN